ncbi:MAG: oligosaccharide flippase family protein [Acidobacteriota bacterium]|nr:MAG: oligosaccharide flippase family protein [Acidobacteriota bacterium]
MWSIRSPGFTGMSIDSDRSRRRLRRAGLTGLATLFSRGVTVLIGLATLPITSHYLGKERFGLWLTLSSLMAWIVIADLGIAVSLINALSTADGREDRTTAQRAVASAFWMTALIAVLVIGLGLITVRFVNWGFIFNLATSQAADEAGPAVLVLLVLCALRLPSSIIGCTYQAYQEGYIYQVWNGVGGLCGAAGLIIAVRLEAGLPWLVGAYLGGMLLTDVLSGIYLFGYRKSWLAPSWREFDFGQVKWLLRRGGQFWIAQISAILLLQIDLLIVARLFGASEVSVYGTTLRLFMLLGSIQMAFIAPLWPAYGEASTRDDVRWISMTYRRSIKISLIWSIPATILMTILMPQFFKILVDPGLVPDQQLTVTMMLTEVINSITRCMSILLNGLGAVRIQAIIGPIAGITNLTLSLTLGHWKGPVGVSLATAICLSVFWVGFLGNEVKHRLIK